MRVLLTNDDGLHAPGLHALAAAAVRAGHDVTAVAPEGDWSGSSAAVGNLGDGKNIRYREVELPGLESVTAIELDASPALCVIASCLEGFGDRPEFVLSGINPGLNTGRATMHSGTVGAALTAANFGFSSVAVSIAGKEPDVRNWEAAGDLALECASWIDASDSLITLNLSVPDRPRADLLDAVVAPLAPFGSVRTKVISRASDHIELGFVSSDKDLVEGTDTWAADAGHVVITPLQRVRPDDSEPLSSLANQLRGQQE